MNEIYNGDHLILASIYRDIDIYAAVQKLVEYKFK